MTDQAAREHRLDVLCSRLLPAQFDEVIYRLNAPRACLSTGVAPLTIRAIELLTWVQANGREALLDQVLDAILGKPDQLASPAEVSAGVRQDPDAGAIRHVPFEAVESPPHWPSEESNWPDAPSIAGVVGRLEADEASEDFLSGEATQAGIGLKFSRLKFVGWLSRQGKSLVAKYLWGNVPFVVKRTDIRDCDLEALQGLCGLEVVCTSWRVQTRVATPICVRPTTRWLYELHTYYDGLSIDQVVSRNRFQIRGAYLGGAHNSIAYALERLHRLGFVHRDVRPQNLLILRDGSLVLLDCTFVCREGRPQHAVDSGTYTPPEQLRGEAVVQSDWYSLAASMYFVAAGYPPSVGAHRVRSVDIARLGIGPMGAFERPDEKWSKMLNPNPSERPRQLWEIRLSEHSRKRTYRLLSVLEVEDLGFLLLGDSHFELVPRSRLAQTLVSQKVEDPDLRSRIAEEMAGRSDWTPASKGIR